MLLETRLFNNTKNYKDYEGQSGIYALLYQNEVIYIGQSVNIRHRLRKHHGVDGQLRRGANVRLYSFLKEHMDEIYFLVLPVEKQQLNAKEAFYINKHKPRFNYDGVRAPFKPAQ